MTAVIIFLSLSIVLLFVAMVLSALAASAAKKNNMADAHKFSMWSAITSGISIFIIIGVMFLYIHSTRILKMAHGALGTAQGYIATYPGVMSTPAY